MTKEEEVQIALGLRVQCSRCGKVIKLEERALRHGPGHGAPLRYLDYCEDCYELPRRAAQEVFDKFIKNK